MDEDVKVKIGRKCEAETVSGHRCKRAAKVLFQRELEERFLLFFKRKVVHYHYFCMQHADKSLVGERVE